MSTFGKVSELSSTCHVPSGAARTNTSGTIGCTIVEPMFTTIGSECTLNAGSIIQCHSQEDGAFKSDIVTLGAGVTVGVGGFVHYGVTLGDGVVLEADSFLMKGEEVPAFSRWGGNPAEEIQGQPVVGVAATSELAAARSAA